MPWYKLPHTGGQRMWFDRERPDLEPADSPAGPKPADEAKPPKLAKVLESKKPEAPAD